MANTLKQIFKQPASFSSLQTGTVSLTMYVVMALSVTILFLFIANRLFQSITTSPAIVSAGIEYEFTAAAYFWSFLISIQVMAVSMLYRPRIPEPHSHAN